MSKKSSKRKGARLGQHFLHSPSALARIRDVADPTGDDLILEIGPGEGALTQILLTFAAKVIAVEKDKALVALLKEKFKKEIEQHKLEVIEQDILEFDPEVLRFYKQTYKIVANIPYYITGAILRKFLSSTYQPELMVLLMQKEVVERIARSKKESLLSLSVKAYGTPKYEFTVPKGAFRPPPQVDSAVLSIRNISRDTFRTKKDEDRFFTLIHAGFAHKRKLLRSNLGELTSEKALENAGIPLTIRAEDLSLSSWMKLIHR